MLRSKRVYSSLRVPVRPLGVQARQYRVLDINLITPAVMRQYGADIVIIDEGTKALEHCGANVDTRFLASCKPRLNRTSEPYAAAVRSYYQLDVVKATPKPAPKPAPKKEVPKEEPKVEVVEELKEEPKVEVVETPKTVTKSTKKKTSKKVATKKSPAKEAPKDFIPQEEPLSDDDLNPFSR